MIRVGVIHRFFVVASILVAAVHVLDAQDTASSTHIVNVEGRAMRVWTAGMDQRQSGRPVIVLEAGAGEGLDTWKPVFAEIAQIAPVVAYDRRGLGGSEPDSVKPTLRRVAQSLHALLQRLNVAPPYILVGHSWGGLVVRAYFDQHAEHVAGLVFLDAISALGPTRAEKAKMAPPEERDKILAPPTLPQIPADTPPGLRAEYEVVGSEMVNDYPEGRSLRIPGGVPIAVVLAAPPGRVKNSGGASAMLAEDPLAALALNSPKGLFVAAGHVGHLVHRDDPQLVRTLIEHVLTHAGVASDNRSR
jgi:pimeloyl-ACP methyl ester carboxylesterase